MYLDGEGAYAMAASAAAAAAHTLCTSHGGENFSSSDSKSRPQSPKGSGPNRPIYLSYGRFQPSPPPSKDLALPLSSPWSTLPAELVIECTGNDQIEEGWGGVAGCPKWTLQDGHVSPSNDVRQWALRQPDRWGTCRFSLFSRENRTINAPC